MRKKYPACHAVPEPFVLVNVISGYRVVAMFIQHRRDQRIQRRHVLRRYALKKQTPRRIMRFGTRHHV
jgi:hypothetical protein